MAGAGAVRKDEDSTIKCGDGRAGHLSPQNAARINIRHTPATGDGKEAGRDRIDLDVRIEADIRHRFDPGVPRKCDHTARDQGFAQARIGDDGARAAARGCKTKSCCSDRGGLGRHENLAAVFRAQREIACRDRAVEHNGAQAACDPRLGKAHRDRQRSPDPEGCRDGRGLDLGLDLTCIARCDRDIPNGRREGAIGDDAFDMMADFIKGGDARPCTSKSCNARKGGDRHGRDLGVDARSHARLDRNIGATRQAGGEIHPIGRCCKINGPQIDPGLVCSGILIDLAIDIAQEEPGLNIENRACRREIVGVEIKACPGGGLRDFAPAHIEHGIDRKDCRSLILAQENKPGRLDRENGPVSPGCAFAIRDSAPEGFCLGQALHIGCADRTAECPHTFEEPCIGPGPDLQELTLCNRRRARAGCRDDLRAQDHIIGDVDPDDLSGRQRLEIGPVGDKGRVDRHGVLSRIAIVALLTIDREADHIERIGRLRAGYSRCIDEGRSAGVDHKDAKGLAPAKIGPDAEAFCHRREIIARTGEVCLIRPDIAQIGAAVCEETRADLDVIPGLDIEACAEIGLNALLTAPERLCGN